jgi:hypothetical protein
VIRIANIKARLLVVVGRNEVEVVTKARKNF